MSPSGAHIVGVNFALKLQMDPLPNRFAANKLRAHFPKLTKAKIFDHDKNVLNALREEGFEHVVMAVPNDKVNELARDKQYADSLVCDVIKPQIRDGLSMSVAIANEPFAPWNGLDVGDLVSAFRNLHGSLEANNLSSAVKITIPFYFGILEKSYPPSEGSFAKTKISALKTLTTLLYETGSTFDINIYPFFSHRDNPQDVSLPYALGESAITVDGVKYNGLLQAQVAAVRAALLAIDGCFTERGLPIVIGETGWPTAGHQAANVENAAKYIKNAVASRIPIYLFEAFDEKKKSGDSGAGAVGIVVEDNWGIFTEAGNLKYNIPALSSSRG